MDDELGMCIRQKPVIVIQLLSWLSGLMPIVAVLQNTCGPHILVGIEIDTSAHETTCRFCIFAIVLQLQRTAHKASSTVSDVNRCYN